MNRCLWSHYNWLDMHFETFLEKAEGDTHICGGIISAHGDKCYSYKDIWKKAGIPFPHGVAIYLLTYIRPWVTQVRNTENGWVQPHQWVIDNYPKFKEHLSTNDFEKLDGLYL